MKQGESLHLTDGKGQLLTALIEEDHKKHCRVLLTGRQLIDAHSRKITVAISLIKNTSRFEWFLEKVTEIGLYEIIPLLCERTEKQKFRTDRMKSILVSSMLQSQQCWLPVLHEPLPVKEVITASRHPQKYIAHCIEGEKMELSEMAGHNEDPAIILIGPEGDFTDEETGFARQHHFVPTALGATRLRTETAGMVAATILIYS